MTNAAYHAEVKRINRDKVIDAARSLFLENGYDRTSLASIARLADVSTATLFKQFPSKAALFAAVVNESWRLAPEYEKPPLPGNPTAGLTAIGRDYACVLTRPEMAAWVRVVIAELPRFPEIDASSFGLDGGPIFERLTQYLSEEVDLGNLEIVDISSAAKQFMSLIAGEVLWPQLLGRENAAIDSQNSGIAASAADTLVARYRPRNGTK